jgi:hypothetical protein
MIHALEAQSCLPPYRQTLRNQSQRRGASKLLMETMLLIGAVRLKLRGQKNEIVRNY